MAPLKISLIVTILNEEQTILDLLEAVRTQTHQPAEVIVVDGGSSDGTTAIIEKYTKHNPHFPLMVKAKKGNRSVGRNLAISLAKNEVIAITDAGCVPQPDWLSELSKSYQHAQSTLANKKIVVAGYYDAQPQTPFEEAVVPYVLVMPDKVNPDTFLPATRSMLVAKKVWLELGGFDEHLSDNEDYAFAKKIAAHPEKYSIVFF